MRRERLTTKRVEILRGVEGLTTTTFAASSAYFLARYRMCLSHRRRHAARVATENVVTSSSISRDARRVETRRKARRLPRRQARPIAARISDSSAPASMLAISA